jgi:hypothetical protein
MPRKSLRVLPMHRRSLPLFLAVGFLALALPQQPGSLPLATAQAQPRRALPPLETDPRLGPVFSRGVEAMLAQRFDEALTTFEDLYRQSPRPTLLYYLGKVAHGQQRLAAAFDLYRRFLRGAGDEIDADTKLEVQQFLASTPAPECEVGVSGEPGALLIVDGRIAGALPLEQGLALSPGTHRLLLTHGRRKVETQVNLLPRRRAEVRFTLVPSLALLTLTPAVLLLSELEPRALEPAMAVPLHNALKDTLAAQNAVLISPETQAELLQRNPELVSCLNQPSCQEKLALLASAQFVLKLNVRSIAGSPAPTTPAGRPGNETGFAFSAKLLDVDVGQVSVQASQTCPDCTLRRAIGQITEITQELFRQASSRPRGTLDIDSDPAGATVQIDGRTLGTTPYHRDTFVGQHEVQISKPGYGLHTSSVQVTEGDTAKLNATLIQTAQPVSPYVRMRKIAKWTLFGAGLASTFLGATLLAAGASRPLCADVSPASMTPCLSANLKPAGIAFLVLGLGSLTASGGLFLYDYTNTPAAPKPSPAPAGAAPLPAATLHF